MSVFGVGGLVHFISIYLFIVEPYSKVKPYLFYFFFFFFFFVLLQLFAIFWRKSHFKNSFVEKDTETLYFIILCTYVGWPVGWAKLRAAIELAVYLVMRASTIVGPFTTRWLFTKIFAHWIWACGSRIFFPPFLLAPYHDHDHIRAVKHKHWWTNKREWKCIWVTIAHQSRTNHSNKHWSYFYMPVEAAHLFICLLLLFIVSTAGHVMKSDIVQHVKVVKNVMRVRVRTRARSFVIIYMWLWWTMLVAAKVVEKMFRGAKIHD